MEDYWELKRLVPAGEWASYLKSAIADMRGDHTYALLAIYAQEGMQEELTALLRLGRVDVSTMVTYMLKLEDSYLPELLPIFEQMMNERLCSASSREVYAQYAAVLKKARKIPRAKALVDQMLQQYRTQYPRRSAMLEEFWKV